MTTVSMNVIKRLDSVAEMRYVFSEVRTEMLNIIYISYVPQKAEAAY
jgi:hypothetical protein